MTSQPDERTADTTPSATPSDGRGTGRVAAAVAPAVALLLWGDVALAQDDDDNVAAVPGPASLILLAVGAGGAALAQRWKNRKK